MDFQNRAGAKPGSGGVAPLALIESDRRERQRRTFMDTTDITRDPYISKNHLGMFECRLCLTLHTNEGSYLSHTQGRKHQMNLERTKRKEGREIQQFPQRPRQYLKRLVKIGRPGYRVTKQFDPVSQQKSLLFEIDYPEIEQGLKPRHRIMSCYEQNREPVDNRYQYVLFAADPYEVIAFKVPNMPVDSSEGRYYCDWNEVKKLYRVQLAFKNRQEGGNI